MPLFRIRPHGIATRLGLGFGFMLALMLALTWVSIAQVNALNANLSEINEVNTVKQRHAINFRGSVHDRAIAIRDVTIMPAAERDAVVALIERLAADYAANEIALDAMIAGPAGASEEELRILALIADIQSRANPLVAEIIELREAGNFTNAHDRLAEVRPLFDAWLAAINQFIDYQEDLNQTIGARVHGAASNFQALALSTLTIALALAVIAAWLVSRSITRPLGTLSSVMQQMANGDYQTEVPYTEGRDEIAEMAASVEVFRQNGLRVAEMTAAEADGIAAALDAKGQIDAVSQTQAVIAFAPDGTILSANANFCTVLGYALEDIRGRHHSMLIDPDHARSAEYAAFWAGLARGESQVGEYRRIGRGGKPVWIQASYNPIFGVDGKVYKIVKFAIDVTGRKAAVDRLREGLAMLARGDLTARIDTAFTAEFEDVRQAFNDSVSQFARIVSDLQTTSTALRTATGEILSGANDLSDRTTRQASSIEETSAAIDQLATTVIGNAQEAEQASARATASSVEAEDGGRLMVQATGAMERINESASRVADIIGVIDQIAFQTNLLALNASVEAARAGEAGKSFAVVAGEVRTLSQSVARSSEEVKHLVEQSVNAVKTGTELVSATSQKLQSLFEGTKDTAMRLETIATQNREQASVIKEISVTVRQMEEMTQQNAALVEETNAAIEQTEEQASALDRIVSTFRMENRPEPARRPSPATAPRRYLQQGNAAMDAEWDNF